MLQIILQSVFFDCFAPNTTLSGNIQTRQIELLFWPSVTAQSQCSQFSGATSSVLVSFPGQTFNANNDSFIFQALTPTIIFLIFEDVKFEDIIAQEQGNYTFTIDIVPLSGTISQIVHTQFNAQQCWSSAYFVYDFTKNQKFQVNVIPNACQVPGEVEVFIEFQDASSVSTVKISPDDSLPDGFHSVYDHMKTKVFYQEKDTLGVVDLVKFTKFVSKFEQDKSIKMSLVVQYQVTDTNGIIYSQKMEADLQLRYTYESVCLNGLDINFFMDESMLIIQFWPQQIQEACIADDTSIVYVQMQYYYTDTVKGQYLSYNYNDLYETFKVRDGIQFHFDEAMILPRDYQVSGQVYMMFQDENNNSLHILTYQKNITVSCIQKIIFDVTRTQLCFQVFYFQISQCKLSDDVFKQNIMLVSNPTNSQKITYLSLLFESKLQNAEKKCLGKESMVEEPYVNIYYEGSFIQRLSMYQHSVIKKNVQQLTYYQNMLGKQYVYTIGIDNYSDILLYFIPIIIGILLLTFGLILYEIRNLR